MDGSPDAVFARHHHAWEPLACHLRSDPDLAYRNGKVNGVITGMRAASGDRVIIADDDVRYDALSLTQVLARLDDADLVIPQNYFSPLPWHAAWDTARTLINRAVSMDCPGTMGVRRAAFFQAGCYNGDVLFENLELIRTMRVAGARAAYDSLGQPLRLAAELVLLPASAGCPGSRPRTPQRPAC